MPITSSSNPRELLPVNAPPQRGTMPSTNTLPSSVITQPPTFLPPISQAINSQPVTDPYTFNIPTCAPLSSQLQTLDGTVCRYHPENISNGIKARTIYQFGPEPTNSGQYSI